MTNKALVVIDLQNDITKNYREIIDTVNQAIDWAVQNGIEVVYIKHNNLSDGTRTFKPGTRGADFVDELKIVSDNIFVKTKSNALTSEEFSNHISKNNITEFYMPAPTLLPASSQPAIIWQSSDIPLMFFPTVLQAMIKRSFAKCSNITQIKAVQLRNSMNKHLKNRLFYRSENYAAETEVYKRNYCSHSI